MEVDFTEVTLSQGYKCLLVFVRTFSGWMEAYPTHTKRQKEVIRLP